MAYVLRDQFTTARAAGAVNGTAAEPTGQTRAVVDSGSNLSIASGALSIAGGPSTWGDPLLHWGTHARALGLTFIFDVTPADAVHYIEAGFSNTVNTELDDCGIFFSAAGALRELSNAAQTVGAYTAVAYSVAVVLRSSGAWMFIKGGAFTYWTLLWVKTTNNAATLHAVLQSYDAAVTYDNARLIADAFVPVPLSYDTFTRADGSLGNSETTGPDSQTTPALAWTATTGTWGVASNAAACSVLSGGLGFATQNTPSPDVIMDAALTRSGGVAGIVLRYVDANNYLIAYHDGTNAKLDKVVSGTPTNLISGAATYGAGNPIRVVLDGTTAELYYNMARVGFGATVPSSSATLHGLYTTNTGNTFDDVQIWARGTANEYIAFDLLEIFDAATLSDSAELSVVTSDSAALTDSSGLSAALDTTDTFAVTEIASLNVTWDVSDSATVTDNSGDGTTTAVAPIVSDDAVLTDNVTDRQIEIYDSAVLSEALARLQLESVTDSATVTESATVVVVINVSDSLTFTDANAASSLIATLHVSDNAIMTDASAQPPNALSLTDAFTFSDGALLLALLDGSDSFTFADTTHAIVGPHVFDDFELVSEDSRRVTVGSPPMLRDPLFAYVVGQGKKSKAIIVDK